MKITAIYTSPRKNSNSTFLADKVLSGLCEQDSAAEVSKFFLAEKKIKGCVACMGCKKNTSKMCVQADDMQEIYSAFEESDTVVLATPLYWWNVSSLLKIMIDRLYCYVGQSVWKGKQVIVVVTGISAVPDAGYDIIKQMLDKVFGYLEAEVEYLFVSADDTRPAKENEQAQTDALALGRGYCAN